LDIPTLLKLKVFVSGFNLLKTGRNDGSMKYL